MGVTLIANIISNWDAHILDKHWTEITHCLKLSLSDADSDVRALARQAYTNLQNLYPQRAEALFQVSI